MHGYTKEHSYWCNWTGSWFTFYADGQAVAYATTNTSDERLKEDIQEVPEIFLKLVDCIHVKKFKIKNMNNWRFGIIAQELLRKAQELGIEDIFDYQIINEEQVFSEDETLYYLIDYEQYLILKNKALENKLEKQEKATDFLLKKLNLQEEYEKGDLL